jgi:hypothetical protein
VNLYEGLTYIQTANNDKEESSDEWYMHFSVNKAVKVYVAFYKNAGSIPNWLSDWENTGNTIRNTDVDLNVYAKIFHAKTIRLGANRASGSSDVGSMYTVFFEEFPIATEIKQNTDRLSNTLQVYPNPFYNQFKVSYSLNDAPYSPVIISFIDQRGRKIKEKIIMHDYPETYSTTFYTDHCKNGFYLIQLSTGKQKMTTKIYRQDP